MALTETIKKCHSYVPKSNSAKGMLIFRINMDFSNRRLLLVCLIIVVISSASANHVNDEHTTSKYTKSYQKSAKTKSSQISVLDNDNKLLLDDNNVDDNSYLGKLKIMFEKLTNHFRKKREVCGFFDVACHLRQKETEKTTETSSSGSTSELSSPPPSSTEPANPLKETTELIDIDNALDSGVSSVRETRSTTADDKRTNIAGMHDDEDYVTQDDSSGETVEGSGEIRETNVLPFGGYNTEPISPSPTNPPILGQPHYYRVIIKVNEPYRIEYQNRSSLIFQNFRHNLTSAIDELYQPLPGRQMSTLIRVQSIPDDPFFFKVTVDIGTLDYYDRNVIEGILKRHIRENRRLGSIMVADDEISFREFGVASSSPESHCRPDQLPCRSGECLDASKRCDNVRDCSDGSDELGCDGGASTPRIGGEQVEFTTLVPGGVPIPIPLPIDRCRGDDKVQCPGGGAYICGDQICDGHPDCAGETDESNCPPACAEDEFMCDLTRCIPKSKQCDGLNDCQDGKDEHGCQVECAADEYRCKNGKCIEYFRRCDYVPDCPEGEDEFACPCSHDEFVCQDGTCLDIIRKCDGHRDCLDGSDERNCPTNPSTSSPACRPDQFRCERGECIDIRYRCNRRMDCPNDDSDERNCPGQCTISQFKCRDGTCIPASQHCNKVPDCPDKSDEQSCPCVEGEFQCANGHCIPEKRRCDKINHCQDGSDEINCRVSCKYNEFQCRDQSGCIQSSQRCDRKYDCSDGSDEDNCNVTTCRSDQFQCQDGTCLNIAQRCNGIPECSREEDERNCAVCSASQFRCNNLQCIDGSRKCDGIADCIDRSDEADCEEGISPCREFDFTCGDGYCIPLKFRCDGKQQCVDATDELNCATADTTTRPSCNEKEFACHDGSCILSSYVCDSIPDCKDKSDENYCPASCASDDVVCGDGRCISPSKKCDREYDCIDGADEKDCGLCLSGDFHCEDGTCVSASKHCDGRSDCRDGTDELHCVKTCQPTQWRCKITGLCLSMKVRCNRREDCPDGSDEVNCPPSSRCKADQFQCHTGVCIPNLFKCDKYSDCSDGSDELFCEEECKSNEFRCRDGTCIDSSNRCDRRRDCPDGSDEADCFPDDLKVCSHSEFTCKNGACIENQRRCDGRTDCSDGSDEADCGACLPSQWSCDVGNCIELIHRCDNIYDCRDFSDEQNCVGCGNDEFSCRSGDCVPSYLRCNAQRDCVDGSDEEGCSAQPTTRQPPRSCAFGQFSCHSGDQCVPQNYHCDGEYHCRDYSDEANCGWRACSRGEFRCENGPCIPEYLRCNGRNDCPYDISDELDCGPGSPARGLNLVTYPSSQIIKEGREVVFQCRDEGPLRARVKWLRDGLTLPPGSRDRDGRLEIPNIQRDQGGTYICEAVGFPPSTPGYRVSVTLRVEAVTEPPTRAPACKSYEATCSNGECIDKLQVCDGKNDCTDGSDELRCNPYGCEPNEFRCNNKKCVSKAWRCDHDNDCGDNSDEENCRSPAPGGVCQFNEYTCQSGTQCIPRAYECDGEFDCQDGSDEKQCSKPKVIIPPPPRVEIVCGVRNIFVINCTAIGGPIPEISWRRNWGHVPQKCTQTSVAGFGVLTCPDIVEEDQGAYSCEALNTRGSDLAVPDANLICSNDPRNPICQQGTFNSEAIRQEDCINCFCFGKTTSCSSADLFIYQIPPPFNRYRIIGVNVSRDGSVEIKPEITLRNIASSLRPVNNGFQIYSGSQLQRQEFSENVIPYFAMPESYLRNQLKSYGGYLHYTLRYDGNGRPISAPDVIISGNDIILTHYINPHYSGQDQEISVRFWHGEWKKQVPRIGEITASREDIMLVLADLENLLIRSQYIDGDILDTSISNIRMDSAGIRNTGLGKAAYVEKCQCPVGYTGLSCEECAVGYERRPGSNRWTGECFKETDESCPPGTYGNPARNIPCQVCPCPLTNPSNQFGRTCFLDTDGQVTCNCPQGYAGRRCEVCDRSYTGNPNRPGDSCKPNVCDPDGSVSPLPDPNSGQCVCKDFTTGTNCNQCKADTFYLNPRNPHGCISCFCSGVTHQCDSSRWYRSQVTAAFARDTQGVKLGEASSGRIIDSGIHVDTELRELIYQDFSRRNPEVYHWMLPPSFLGNKVTSYGGYLNYTVRYVPTPGGQSSRNNAPDVELISANDIKLLYFKRDDGVEPNRPQTVSVPLLEQYWQRHDGQAANREHLLMALADLEGIYIKATYTTNTREAALVRVSLDIAEERNTGQERALEVEQCQCPVGYRGLSCEDCDVGYTRSEEGLYLGTCEPCSCNGHSTDCDSETGICLNCRQGTTGDNCDVCQEGYEGNPLSSEGCTWRGSSQCICDPRGSTRLDCPLGQCVCKTNVEGSSCDQCRPGTFGLSPTVVEGCHKCFCSGITDDCQASNLYVTQIPMQILDSTENHFSLSDSSRRNMIKAGFTLNSAKNEIGYVFPPGRTQHLFWSLPPSFTGNKITSYGGSLTLTQRFEATAQSRVSSDKDVVLIGNGITVYWNNPNPLELNISQSYAVPLREDNWQRLDTSGIRPASRSDLLTALANLEAILVLATPYAQLAGTYLSDVALDTAVSHFSGEDRRAQDVEVCRCPIGYRGTSCESCAIGYYRDTYDRSIPSAFGVCKKCPCNDNEESCVLEADERVLCSCKKGFTGRYCETQEGTSVLKIMITPDHIENILVGNEQTFVCEYESAEDLTIKYELVPPSPPEDFYQNWEESYERTLKGGRKRITMQMYPGLKLVICTFRYQDNVEIGKIAAMVKVTGYPTPDPGPRPTPQPPRISISISEPTIQIAQIGETVRFKCTGRSIESGRSVTLQWSKENGELPRGRSIADREGLLIIQAVDVSDSGTYVCTAFDGFGVATERAVLSVGGSSNTRPEITISPRVLDVREGEPVDFRCRGSGIPAPVLRWTKVDGSSLNPFQTFRDGIFHIPRATKSDDGNYICTGRNPSGEDSQTATLIVRETNVPIDNKIEVVVDPLEYNADDGGTVQFTCQAVGGYTVRWSRERTELPPSSTQRDGILTIYNASPSDSGIYICTATDPYTGNTGESVSRLNVVSSSGPPTVQIEPERLDVAQGYNAEFRCDARGAPTPVVRWSKSGEELGNNAQIVGNTLKLVNVMVRDRGMYMCSAESPAGSAIATAILEVERRERPAIEMYPKPNQTVTEGGSLILQCRITGGDPPPRLTWVRSDGRPIGGNIEELPNGVLRFNNVKLDDGGEFMCNAENEAGRVSAIAIIEIQSLPVVIVTPTSPVHSVEGQRVRLDCRATGKPSPTVSWSKHTPSLTRTRYETQTVTSEQQLSAVYEITRVTKSDEGVYSCVARNAAGTTEERVMLTVDEDNNIGPTRGDIPGGIEDGANRPRPPYPTRPTSPYGDEVYTVPIGGRAEMRCQVQRLPEDVFLDWRRSDQRPLPANSIVTNGTLYIDSVERNTAGEYYCIGISNTGSILFTAKANLVVIAPPHVSLDPTRQVVRPGDNVYTICSATGDDPITIEWSGINRELPRSATVNGGLLQFRAISVDDAGRYLCKAVNHAGEAEATAEVIVVAPEYTTSIVAAERDVSTFLGSSLAIRCIVSPDSSGRQPQVTWTRENLPLPSTAVIRGEVLQLTNVKYSDEGKYTCEINTPDGRISDYTFIRIDRTGGRCGSGQFTCIRSRECIPIQAVCDRVVNCRDESDERFCRRGRETPPVTLRIQPSLTSPRAGDSLEVRCIATGDAGSAVISWTKVSDRFQNNVQAYANILRISDLREANGGLYRCRAKTPSQTYHEDYVLKLEEIDVNNDPPSVETKTAPYGKTVELQCKTDLEPPVSFQWKKQSGLLPKDAYTREEWLIIDEAKAQDAGTYVCVAENAHAKLDIPVILVVTGVVPYFAQAPVSYMVLPTLPDAYLQFDIEVSFKPESLDGLILYNGQQKGGSGDFISLGLNRGFVEFRFDVGSGSAVIRSNRPLRLGQWHTVNVTRSRKEGTLTVDGEGPFTGSTTGTFQGLDLVEPLYVGGVPDFKAIHKAVGHSKGLVGCVSRLKISGTEHDLVRDATFSKGVTTCETCAENPCINRGICQEAPTTHGYICICPSGFSGQNCDKVGETCYPGVCNTGRCFNKPDGILCYCPLGKTGPRCERDVTISEPFFSDNSYLAYPTPKALRKLKISLKLKPSEIKDGIVLYCGQDEQGLGDFTSLSIKDNRIEFRFDTGSGPAILRSKRQINPNEWITVTANRDRIESKLIVDDEEPVYEYHRAPALVLRTPLYVGGYDKEKIRVSPQVGVENGFNGCVSEVEVSGLDLDIIESAVDSANVDDCPSSTNRHQRESPCYLHNPCLNGGTCHSYGVDSYNCSCPEGYSGKDCELEADLCYVLQPCKNNGDCTGTSSSYKCQCTFGHTGPTCEHKVEFSTSISFQGDGYAELSGSLLPHKTSTEVIIIEFSTNGGDGLILWHGQESQRSGRGQDFLAVSVVQGYLELSFELGSGPAVIRSDRRVSSGRRHRAVLSRNAREGSLELDNDGNVRFGESGGHLTSLNTVGNIYIGGVPDFNLMTSGLFTHGFSGCIHSLELGDHGPINFNKTVLSSRNALPCSNVPENDYNDENYEDFVN